MYKEFGNFLKAIVLFGAAAERHQQNLVMLISDNNRRYVDGAFTGDC